MTHSDVSGKFLTMSQNSNFGSKLEQPVRLADQVADLLRLEIDKGTFQVGDKIPSESTLAKTFGVSRTVIREALGRLKYDGFLDSRQGLGVTVTAEAERKTFRFRDQLELDTQNLRHLFELRAILEGDAASLAALRRSQDDLDDLRTSLRSMDASIADKTDGTDFDFDFHRIVARASGNPYLLDLMYFLNTKLKGVIKTAREHSSLQPGLPPVVQKEHEAIFEALMGREPERARQAMLSHISQASCRLGLKVLDDFESDSGDRDCGLSGPAP